MADVKKCDPNDPSFDPCCVTVDQLSADAQAVLADLKAAAATVGGDVTTLAGDLKCLLQCTEDKALAAFKSIWASVKK